MKVDFWIPFSGIFFPSVPKKILIQICNKYSLKIFIGYFKDILTNIMNKTPHSWPSHTLADFPPILRDFYNEHPVQRDNRQTLMTSVQEEYRVWTTMTVRLSQSNLFRYRLIFMRWISNFFFIYAIN
jgi:hypothetical protein